MVERSTRRWNVTLGPDQASVTNYSTFPVRSLPRLSFVWKREEGEKDRWRYFGGKILCLSFSLSARFRQRGAREIYFVRGYAGRRVCRPRRGREYRLLEFSLNGTRDRGSGD